MSNKKKVILSDGKEIIVYKLKIKHIRNITKILSQLPENFKFGDSSDNNFVLTIKKLSTLLFENFDDVLTLLAECTDSNAKELEDISLDDLTLLIREFYNVNKDFLGKYLMVTEE